MIFVLDRELDHQSQYIKDPHDDLGPPTLKNIAEPARAWRVKPGAESAASTQPASPASQALALLQPTIAVLPFQNMSTDPEQEDFTEGLVEDVMTALSRFEDDAAAAGVRAPGGTGRSGIGMVQGGLDAVVGLVATPAPGSGVAWGYA
jgi:hypothetical protein